GEIAPPSTTMPSGAPREWSHCGKRCSSGRISALPSGDRPITVSAASPPITNHQPSRRNRVARRSAPSSATEMTKFEGSAKKPRTFERTKNIGLCGCCLLILLPRLVARLGLGARRIEAGQLHPALDLADNPGLPPLVLLALVGDELEQVLRD